MNYEDIWTYPETPRVEPVDGVVKIQYDQFTIAETSNAFRLIQCGRVPGVY